MTIGALRAEPGRKTRGSLPADLGTTTVEVPLILVNGSRPGPRVVITGGVHGGEVIGVDAATRLAGLLEPDDVAGQVVICPVANPPAVYGGRLNISPLDGVNINRVFPGDRTAAPPTGWRPGLFEHLIDGADAYVPRPSSPTTPRTAARSQQVQDLWVTFAQRRPTHHRHHHLAGLRHTRPLHPQPRHRPPRRERPLPAEPQSMAGRHVPGTT
ncbi:succinylglutamate desuccinylase/aspartoacylase domain-containing protein [Streptomyces cavernae]|uniref:succinylglutamate desuccinylase/aspartoacylase domain-containing protein n=1 Tax=Streptomyces cavernae TaxID=2259034 RepID=UPI001EE4A13C|nr:succinylglutamate desuccinylase/aspartoacylase family protein [Streptomyces cavernae]